ncbi:MAG TPA: ATP-dependent DNA helicase [Candidatus Pacearchaeota archaeon]|nr:UvrD-helicase domain-containing protein [Candidatus Parcubacteria bacterium]HOU45934.1 ATP-dependent DNA helicase [Candidatus Pacearchaeota archaeon]HPM08227.1 ATP-dependent DNA helicase [Candidatus Pacearchaeota archaeon]HQI74453.1 ATP-dependent DNA helicase [Candidatus Pacearchaeota archaeon]
MLNEEQKNAVIHGQGPLLIVAGAGTGKTTILTQRIIHLINEKGLKPDNILAVTFTEKAAGEMEERVLLGLKDIYADLWISTFHSFCERILRQHSFDIGISDNFKIIQEAQAWMLFRENIELFDFDYYRQKQGNPVRFISALLNHFSRCKDEGIYPKDYLDYAQNLKLDLSEFNDPKSEESRINEIAKAYGVYQKLLLENNYLDFGDLINYCYKLFLERPNILEKYRQQFEYILIDEFQDTNWMQYELIKLLAYPRNNITVAADDDQSIYRFRGASVSNVLQFRKDFPKAKSMAVNRNYRSGQKILDLAYNFIQGNNPDRLEYQSKIDKKLISQKGIEADVKSLSFSDVYKETQGVANKILEIKKENDLKFKDFLILVRANSHAQPFCAEFDRQGIPYQFLASQGLYLKPIIIDAISYLKVLDNVYDDAAMYRVVSCPAFNLNKKDIAKIVLYQEKGAISIYEGLKQLPMISGLESETPDIVARILSLIAKHQEQKNINEIFIGFLQDSGYLDYILKKQKTNFLAAKEEIDLIQQFAKKIKAFMESQSDPSLNIFIKQIKMELDAGEEGSLEPDLENSSDAVKVMTIHGAKGLEFENVFIVNMVRDRFPCRSRSQGIALPDALVKEILPQGDAHLQEERRLLYVAMTRAKKGLFFTWARDYGGKKTKPPSQFLVDLGMESEEKSIPIDFYDNKFQEEFDDGFQYEIPKIFSFTQLAAYQKCPWQYRFAHVLKLPVKGNGESSFGKTIHNVLHKFGTIYAKGAQQKDLFGESQEKKPEYKDLLAMYEKEWIDEWFQSKQEKERYKKMGIGILDIFFKDLEKTKIFVKDGEPYLEKGFKIKVGDYDIKGKIDRINQTEKGIEIMDYKTGKSKEDLDKVKKQQLMIYRLAAIKEFGIEPSNLCIYYLRDDEKVDYQPKDKEIDSFSQEIIQVIENIKKKDFSPKPGFDCQYCDYKDICEFRE